MIYNPKILIADDEPRFCECLKILLEDQGYDIHATTSGKEAQQFLLEHKFDIAILDISIPDISGLELIDFINNNCPDTIMIVVTGNACLDLAVNSLRKGAFDFIRKPFEFEELLTTIQNALSQNKLKTEKNEINEQLEISEDRYRYLVQNSPDIIYTLDKDGHFTFTSDSVERILGLNSQSLIGKHYTHLIHDEDLEKAKWAFNERRTGKRANSWTELRFKSFADEDSHVTCEVKHATFELKSTGMYDDNLNKKKTSNYIGTHGVARNISDRKQLETQLQQAQKLESIGTLAGGIAHDFNNLLMIIQGNLSLVLMEINSSNTQHQRLKKIEESIQSAAGLTNQLLGFARGGKYNARTIDINTVLRETSQMFGRTKKEIVLLENYQKNIWAVEADTGQIKQVLLNLYVNAFHAMPAGGELRLSSKNFLINGLSGKRFSLKPGKYVEISVTDNGTGMDEKTRQRIFEPFFTTKEMGRGTGLGLASAYGIIKNHKGLIEVESRLGVGTTFHIYLPATEQDMETEGNDGFEIILKGTETVLLVDDEENILDVGKNILNVLGYNVLCAINGMKAIDLYETHKSEIDIVILDMIMPGMGGGKTYDTLKKINPKIKVLLCSGYSEAGEAAEILKRGCTGFIKKPFNVNELSEKLRQIIDERA